MLPPNAPPLQAFDSPTYPHLATLGIDGEAVAPRTCMMLVLGRGSRGQCLQRVLYSSAVTGTATAPLATLGIGGGWSWLIRAGFQHAADDASPVPLGSPLRATLCLYGTHLVSSHVSSIPRQAAPLWLDVLAPALNPIPAVDWNRRVLLRVEGAYKPRFKVRLRHPA